jgi:hypothetical protein
MIETPREKLTKSEGALREFALKFPETHEDFPWGHRALKVKGKVFVFMGGCRAAQINYFNRRKTFYRRLISLQIPSFPSAGLSSYISGGA